MVSPLLELAKQYDNYVAQKAVAKQPPLPKKEIEPESEEEEEETIIVKKPKKKIKKKIIFESESEDEEAVVVHKKKEKPQPKQPLENLVYQSNKDQLYQRMVEERIRHAMIGYGNSLGV